MSFMIVKIRDIALARDVYELAALHSVHQKDETAFERHVAQAKTLYVDYANVIAPSSRQTLILGLNLLRLMAQNRIAEFHTELELIPSSNRSDKYIDYALRLEHYLMEGSYSKIRDEKKASPHPVFAYFIDRLMLTVREEIAACCERAYMQLPVDSAMRMLSLADRDELEVYCELREWKLSGSVIRFEKSDKGILKMESVPSGELIKRSLEYAKELEQII